MEVACTRTNLQVVGRNGLKIVIENVGASSHNNFQRAFLAQEVGRQDLNGCSGRNPADRVDNIGKMLRAAIAKIVTID